jgi:hypothetical protein
MKKTLYTILFLVSVILFPACSERIDLDLKASEPKIVIYGCITDVLSSQKITISRSVPYFDNQHSPVISGAEVTITSSNNERWILAEYSEKGVYETVFPRAGVACETYSLRVEYDFDGDGVVEVYEASSYMHPGFVIDSVEIKSQRELSFNYYTVNLYGQEPEGKDYYMNNMYINSESLRLSDYSLIDDMELLDGKYMNGVVIYAFCDIADIDRYSEERKEREVFVGSGDELIVEVNRIEKGYLDFISQCQREKNGENPFFGGPPSNIRGNISNGAVGFFAAYSPSRVQLVIP